MDVAVLAVLGVGGGLGIHCGTRGPGRREAMRRSRRSLTHGGTRGEDIKDFIARQTSVPQLSPPPH